MKVQIEEYDPYTEVIDDEEHNQGVALYEFLADKYLLMSKADFGNADWEATKAILEGCNFRTIHSLADISHNIFRLFEERKTRAPLNLELSQEEHDELNMFILWRDWKTKPWEINGGRVYEEDINFVMKVKSFQSAASDKKQAREDAQARLKARMNKPR